MKEEYDALIRNKTWRLIDKTPIDNVINYKWVFKVKQKDDDLVELLKAQSVSSMMKQIEDIDHTKLSPQWLISIDQTDSCYFSHKRVEIDSNLLSL